MSYIFENTFNELEKCYKIILDEGGVEELELYMNKKEEEYLKKLLNLCKEMSENFNN